MRSVVKLFLLLGFLSTPALADGQPKAARMDDVKSLDAIIAALYDVVSGSTEEPRDWDRMKSLFIPEGKLIPTGANGANVMTIDDYAVRGDEVFAKVNFYEIENSRKVEQFGHIAHVFSTYESRHNPADAEPFQRGINSIQLMFDGNRWWIVNVFWQAETKDIPLPEKYLK